MTLATDLAFTALVLLGFGLALGMWGEPSPLRLGAAAGSAALAVVLALAVVALHGNTGASP
jgi:hypothetical protein